MKVINLLPKARQQEIRYQGIYDILVRVIIASVISFAAVFVVQFLTKLYLAAEIKSTAAQIAQIKGQVNKDDNLKIKNQIKALNATINDYVSLAYSAPKWSKVLRAFAEVPAPAIKISSLNIDIGNKKINITGFAPTRDEVIGLYNDIKADDKEFYGIDYPLENVAVPKNVYFHFSFSIRDDLLK